MRPRGKFLTPYRLYGVAELPHQIKEARDAEYEESKKIPNLFYCYLYTDEMLLWIQEPHENTLPGTTIRAFIDDEYLAELDYEKEKAFIKQNRYNRG